MWLSRLKCVNKNYLVSINMSAVIEGPLWFGLLSNINKQCPSYIPMTIVFANTKNSVRHIYSMLSKHDVHSRCVRMFHASIWLHVQRLLLLYSDSTCCLVSTRAFGMVRSDLWLTCVDDLFATVPLGYGHSRCWLYIMVPQVVSINYMKYLIRVLFS